MIASRTSWTLPQSAALPVGRMMTLVTRRSTLALRSASTMRAHRRRRLEELAEDAAGLGLLEVAADVEQQRRVGGDLRPAPHREAHEQQPGRRDGDGDEDEHDHDARRRV